VSNLINLLRQAAQPIETKGAALDAVSTGKSKAPVKGRAETYLDQNLQLETMSILKEWADMSEGDLDEDETFGERLHNLLVLMADEDGDEVITKDEELAINAAKDVINSYLEQIGVESEDIGALLDDRDEDAAERVREAVSEDDTALDSMVFGEEDEDEDEVMDAAGGGLKINGVVPGKKLFVSFHHGVRIKKWKRVSGRPKKPTAAQKAQRMKALIQAKKPDAIRLWKKSMLNRRKAGVKHRMPA